MPSQVLTTLPVQFDTYVKNKGHDKGVFCAGCHDPALLQSGEN